MPRSAAAYLVDILDACDSIGSLLDGVDLATYEASRGIRSAVEREFIIVGEAVSALGRLAPEAVDRLSDARMIVGFRNVLTHDYAAVDNETVLGTASESLPILAREAKALLREIEESDEQARQPDAP
jgi:uncharacterized protein with HEPN domain